MVGGIVNRGADHDERFFRKQTESSGWCGTACDARAGSGERLVQIRGLLLQICEKRKAAGSLARVACRPGGSSARFSASVWAADP